MASEDVELPPTIARLWTLTEADQVRPGPRPALSVGAITRAAIELADAEGLGALSMARIADRLGFTTMSLYRYVASKDELLSLLLDAVTGLESMPELAPSWRPALREFALWQIRILLAHPWLFALPMVGPPVGPNALRWVDHGLGALSGTPLEPWEKLAVIGLVSSYGLSEARLTSDQGPDPVPFGRYLSQLVDPEQLPALGAVVASGQIDGRPVVDEYGIDASTHFGLERILDGIQAYIDSRQRP